MPLSPSRLPSAPSLALAQTVPFLPAGKLCGREGALRARAAAGPRQQAAAGEPRQAASPGEAAAGGSREGSNVAVSELIPRDGSWCPGGGGDGGVAVTAAGGRPGGSPLAPVQGARLETRAGHPVRGTGISMKKTERAEQGQEAREGRSSQLTFHRFF